MTASKLTDEQIVMLQLRIMSALSFYRQRPEKEAKAMTDLLMLSAAAASEVQERRKTEREPVAWKVTFTQIGHESNTFSKVYFDEAEKDKWVKNHELGGFKVEIVTFVRAVQ